MYVISLGGSIVAPDRVDVGFLHSLRSLLAGYLAANEGTRMVIVVGGGGPAREYQRAYREVARNPNDDAADWIGVAATRLNGMLLHGILHEWCEEELLIDPMKPLSFTGRLLVAAGWKPGFSTDNVAVTLAERFGADTVVNLSNISHVYSGDPKLDPSAVALDQISWDAFRRMVGNEWSPGRNLPFDPIAAGRASELHLRVIVADGRDLANLERILEGALFRGTTIGPA